MTTEQKPIIDNIFNKLNHETAVDADPDTTKPTVSVTVECRDNVVSEKKLRMVQSTTLNKLKDYLSKTYGPFGSMTDIITGNDKNSILADYSKDGLKVLKNITFDQPIEMSIESEVVDICKYVESKIGDGTTSAVILSSFIFDGLNNIQTAYNLPPRRLIQCFDTCINNIKEEILSNRKDITIDDIYKICMISTNGNKEVSENIETLYKQYGFDASIDVNISNDENNKVVAYDGLTVNQGYSDPAYINNTMNGTATIRNAHVYQFSDPIDTPELVSYLEKILMHNIFEPLQDNTKETPTVIVTPKISRDASNLLSKLVSILYTYDNNKMQSQKPAILIITNLSPSDEDIATDICTLCKCKRIIKYIDPKIQKADQDAGNAPTIDTIADWYGTAEEVTSDSDKTKFINPISMITEGDKTFDSIINFLTAELNKSIANNDNPNVVGRLRKRIRCLNANMIEYLVGGISISDRNQLKDLVEDAVKNCASASEFGVGRAANYEGLAASYKFAVKYLDKKEYDNLDDHIMGIIYYTIFSAYYSAADILYSTVSSKDWVDDIIINTIESGHPFNVMDIFDILGLDEIDTLKNKDDGVLCSIRTDVEILDAISKIITTMVTSNQCLLQAVILNKY